MIVIPTGYMNSGSSAVTDLLSEFKDFSNVAKSQEFIFMHCPYGVLELENSLLSPVSHLSSKESLKNFRNMMLKLYDLNGWWPSYYKTYISDKFMDYVDDYIEELIDHRFKGFWYMDEFPVKRTIKEKIIHRLTKSDYMDVHEMVLSYPTKEKFYKSSKKLIKKILTDLNQDNQKNVIVDQLLLPYNIKAIDNYFDDAKMIIVERDPRDAFILNKKNVSVVPFPLDALEYAKVYKNMRCLAGNDKHKNVLRVKFEDLIYDYENTLKVIYKFLGVTEKEHVNKRTRLVPERSIDNTQLFRNYENQEEIKIIEKELKEYLYDFPYVHDKKEREVF